MSFAAYDKNFVASSLSGDNWRDRASPLHMDTVLLFDFFAL